MLFLRKKSGSILVAAATSFVSFARITQLEENDPKNAPKLKKYIDWNQDWDLRNDNYLTSEIPKKEQPYHQIVLIRHGQYVESPKAVSTLVNSDTSFDSQQVLTELGRQQAIATGKRLKELLEYDVLFPIDTVYYSTMARATETCKLILSAMSKSDPSLDSDVLSSGVPGLLQPHQVKPCSMITEGAVYHPSPPFFKWPADDREFYTDQPRVLFPYHSTLNCL